MSVMSGGGRTIRAASERNTLRRLYRELRAVGAAVADGGLIADRRDCDYAVDCISAACNLIAGVGERLSQEVQS